MREKSIPIPDIIQPQQSVYRQLVDPDNTLPNVLLHTSDQRYSEGTDGVVSATLCFDGTLDKKVVVTGTLSLAIPHHVPTDPAAEASFMTIERSRWCKARGVGLATYILAAELADAYGAQMTTGSIVSTRALKMWNRLIALGVAEIVEPFKCVLEHFKVHSEWPPDDFYQGKARVLPSKRIHNTVCE